MLIFNGKIEIPDIFIDPDKCDLCIKCLRTCPMQVFAVVEKRIVQMKDEICIACRNCEVVCDKRALQVKGMYRVHKNLPEIGYFNLPEFPEYKKFLRRS